ncbi:MAG TPA: hypothetical protein GX405_16360 [Rhizobiales bacterium]|nr:hypothetical protein [Hyphomicrobiales bacterium]
MFGLRMIRRLVKAIVYLVVLVLLIPVLGLVYGFATTSAPESEIASASPPPAAIGERLRKEIPGYQRPEESTYLTYPEWAIVYAAREYARFVAGRRESGFPYWAYVGRFWQDYATMIRASSAYPFNGEYHLMLVVIGTSHTIEHVLQWAYENSVGRLTEWTSGSPVTADRYLAATAAEYAAFLDQVPWYEFPYAEKRAGLIALATPPDEDAIRTGERKAAYGLAYAIKQAYADLIRSGLAASSAPAELDIHVWAKGPVGEAVSGEADTALEGDFGADGAVFVTRRYQVFTDMIPRLIAKGVSFVEIGGNDEILVTVLSDEEIGAPEGTAVLFSYELPAQPGLRRTGLVARVDALHTAIPDLARNNAHLEHVYDY